MKLLPCNQKHFPEKVEHSGIQMEYSREEMHDFHEPGIGENIPHDTKKPNVP